MTNQHTKTDVLFLAKGSPITELRIYDKERIVLYTENPWLFERLRRWKQMLHLVPYNIAGKMLGADLYFPKSATKELLKALNKGF